MTMRAVVVDDEPLARSRLQRLLEKIGVNCVATGENGAQAIDLVERFAPDFLFLDISMPVMNGMQAAVVISKLETPPAIVFCTAHDEFAIEAFQTNAAAYLLKPVFEDTLREAVVKATKLTKVQVESALEKLRPVQYLTVRVPGGTQRLPVTEFVYFQSIEKNVYAVTHDNKQVLIEQTLKELEESLGDSVVCTYRGTLANRHHVVGMLRDADGKTRIKLTNGVALEVSRRQLSEVKACFD